MALLFRCDAGENARLALDALAMTPGRGIPTAWLNVMDVPFLETFSGHAAGDYRKDPERVYLDFQRAAGVGLMDQFIPDNPGTMGGSGYENDTPRGATTGGETPVLDGLAIVSPEAVVEHLERFVFPGLEHEIAACDEAKPDTVAALIAGERDLQTRCGAAIVKAPYGDGFQHFPYLRYGAYGYVHYLTAYIMYPEVMERDFALQGELARKRNRIAAQAIVTGGLPRVLRLDHDMADSRGTLVDVRSLDRLWFPHFARSIEPFLDAEIRLVWHCDGHLMAMVPRLIEVGIGGFQGFQYEAGMDYPRLCRMRARDGGPLMIWAGVSVTRTLPLGTPDDVRNELRWLVENGPEMGLFLGLSSSATPGVPWPNLETLLEGLAYYRRRGRPR